MLFTSTPSFHPIRPRTALVQTPSRQARSYASQIPLHCQKAALDPPSPANSAIAQPYAACGSLNQTQLASLSKSFRENRRHAHDPEHLERPSSDHQARYNPRTSPRAIRRSDRILHDRCAGNHGNAPRGSASAVPRRSKRGTAAPYDRRPPQSTRDATAHP